MNRFLGGLILLTIGAISCAGGNGDLAARARAQYLAGDAAAAESFRQLQAVEPDNTEAAYFLARIARESASDWRARSSRRMMNEVDRAWQRLDAPGAKALTDAEPVTPSPVAAKLDAIVLPTVNFNGVELDRVVTTLSLSSAEFDRAAEGVKGVNIVL